MSMNQILANMYGTAAPAAQEDLAKVAAEELFVKSAEAEGIDLTRMSDEDVSALFAEFQQKLAEDGEDKGEDKDDEKKKKEKAEKEFSEKKAAQEKFAESDFAGRQMAHAYVDELRKIAGTFDKAQKGVENFGRKVVDKAIGFGGDRVHPRTAKGIGAAIGTGAAAAAAGAAYGAHRHLKKDKEEKKEASALDQLAFSSAVEKAAAAGFDPTEAGTRINAAYTLGMLDSDAKIAAAADTDQAVDIRSLEMLEVAGYPVQWNV